ncbi:hypothetical protein RW03080701_186 [Synechococcus phage S-RIM8]|uniref:Gp190 n=2 Tax=Neptunevirus srim18 TaxID=2734121 RepID=A0A1D7SA47_9CAUD|nr:major head protein [Synechococcus phage S-RIM8 A.HR1]YP_009783098.1 major head protein [Synechococcus phage S-RIM8]AFB15449.1 gp190 [Synechococcus phage S-RIM8 A.HR5]AFB17884.1 gp190 [Synechococcus phage S-RIM8 A.HR3]AGH57862.1 hypothetical protein CPJG_00110 [Synechococcus phage KBS-M-1A]AFB17674.1 hypothetical protein SXDG_00164 [Synechococcus phage S-RIM8 A.HR1]AOO10336.1 hypothetical protein RW01021201_188 [Synechococcus phage S-RIM8]
MTIATAGTGGFSGSADATGPNAGYDPVMKFRKKLKKKKETVTNVGLGESTEQRSALLQYKVTIPELGDTVIYASSGAELARKLRMIVAPQHRADIKLERIMPAEAGKFFMDKRSKHMRNVAEQDEKQMQQQMTQQQIANEKKKVQLKTAEMQKQLQKKVQMLKNKQRVGGAQATVDQ